ncbi:MAG: hypothetical protein WAL56_02365 [Candidatus Sulfotelmatobacter sp.]
MESLQQELIHEGDVILKRRKGPAEILRQIALKLSDDLGAGGVRGRWLALHCALLAEQGQQSLQCFRIAPAKALLPTARPEKSIHDPAVQLTNLDMFVSKPPTEIGDCYDLPSDRVARVALFGDRSCISIEVFTQRPLAKAFNRA